MRNIIAPNTQLGYCTNVHAGATIDQTLANLQHYALPVKQLVSPDQPMGVGLWLSAQAARELLASHRVEALRDWLAAAGLNVFTLNGFPHDDFHQPVVKHAVYEPNWQTDQRLQYTHDLIDILTTLLPEGSEGSISTLPLGWRAMIDNPLAIQSCRQQLLDLVHHLARIELDTGKYIHLDLEPEPGCFLERADDVITFFQEHLLLNNPDEISVRAYLRICHDICHAAVMHESQREVLAAYRRAGLKVGKVQISSAIEANFDIMPVTDRQAALQQLAAFAEPRYLHQTTIRHMDGSTTMYEDLAQALDQANDEPADIWRSHFHVPVFADSLDLLSTTQRDIQACLRAIEPDDEVHHFEIETYAWQVLPSRWRNASLTDSIAREFAWVIDSCHPQAKDQV